MGGKCSCFDFLQPADPYVAALRGADRELRAFIDANNCNPILVRLAWHDSGTFDQRIESWPEKGGANAGIRFDPELTMGANAGLSKAKGYIQDIHDRYPMLSFADLIQMGSALSIEMAGGPKIEMKYGRVSITDPSQCAGPKSREGFADNTGLPDAMPPFGSGDTTPAAHLRSVFGKKMGFNDQEIVALSGAHTIGRAFKNRSGTCPFGYLDSGASKYCKSTCVARADGKPGIGMAGGGAWTKNWLTFDNSYFTKWKESVEDPDLVYFPTDVAVAEDPGFKPFFDKYAADQSAFFADYAKAHKKLSELGCKWEPPEGIVFAC